MLLDLDRLLKKQVNVVWVVYHDLVYQELIKNGIEKNRIELIDFIFPFIKKPLIIKKIMNRVLHFLFKEKAIKYYLDNILKKIKRKYTPKLWITDTSKLLSEVGIASPKVTVLHSVTYKKFYLSDSNIKYDIIFFPGSYHKKRFERFYSQFDLSKKRMEIIGNLKIARFVGNKTLDESPKNKLLESYELDPKWPLVIYAPTHDAFHRNRFFPEHFGDQYDRLKDYAEFLMSKKHNLIIKFHHYMIKHIDSKKINEIISSSNVAMFIPFKEHDTLEGAGDDLLRACDIVVGDTSGILTTALYLNKKIIFIEPGKGFDWEEADIEKNLRPGYVCETFGELIDATISYLDKDPFVSHREQFIDSIFYNKDENAYLNLKDIILDYVS